ncbi:MAG: hypothetical protein V1899_02565 [Planctomycetota bacterium]
MTKLLKQAFSEASQLSDTEQNIMAKWMLLELAAEKKWEQNFAESEDMLDLLADEAIKANKQGKTKLLDINNL